MSSTPQDQGDWSKLARELYQLSNEAFELAQHEVAMQGDRNDREQRAKAIDQRLDALWPKLQEATAFDPGLTQAWSDARLDLLYVLSSGTLSTSTRLFQFLEERKTKKG